MTVSDTPLLGSVKLSGTTAVIMSSQDYVVEHKMPGMEGGVVEREGRTLYRIDVHGFLYSGADDQYRTLMSGVQTTQTLTVPSTISGNFFYSGQVLVEDIRFYSVPGKGYSYYTFRIRLVGTEVVIFVPTASGGITYLAPNVVNAQAYVSYLYWTVVFAQAYIDYVFPNLVNGQTYGTYLQNLSGNFNSGGSGYAQ